MRIVLISVLLTISFSFGEIFYDMRKVNKTRIAQIETLKDCRMELQAYIMRQRGDLEDPKHNINICHLDPLDEACSCARSREDD